MYRWLLRYSHYYSLIHSLTHYYSLIHSLTYLLSYLLDEDDNLMNRMTLLLLLGSELLQFNLKFSNLVLLKTFFTIIIAGFSLLVSKLFKSCIRSIMYFYLIKRIRYFLDKHTFIFLFSKALTLVATFQVMWEIVIVGGIEYKSSC